MTPIVSMLRRVPKRVGLPALFATAASLAIVGAAPAAADQITVVIERVTALDRIDPLGQADFLARVTIAGEVFQTKRERRHDDLVPTNWVFTKDVAPGTHSVKIEIYDKDILTRDDQVDINRVDPKRDLDFSVNTRRRPCRLPDFAGSPRCGLTIVREGGERRRARLSFRVEVNR
ncbi:MAG: hypothetical protein R3D67_12710 [Hyphomicrobiaceae bacterium]